MANPDWTREELILALDLYFREPTARGSKTHPGCLELSNILNLLPIHAKKEHEKTFRNANGIAMKLSNFLKYDPTYKGVGLRSGSKLESEVWNAYANNLEKLQQVASAIRDGIELVNSSGTTNYADIEADEEAEEGRVLTFFHKKRERNNALVQKKKEQILHRTGTLECEVCGFDFATKYGPIGVGYAECHHDRPISEMRLGEKTKLSDLKIVCANCHRMLHRARPWLTVNDLRVFLSKVECSES